jgi:hypothetical protein
MTREALALVGGVRNPRAELKRPADGDVVITPDDHVPRRYAISQVPGGPQVSWTSRDEALEVAKKFARHHVVDVWVIEDLSPTQVSRHRPAVSSRSAEASPTPRG